MIFKRSDTPTDQWSVGLDQFCESVNITKKSDKRRKKKEREKIREEEENEGEKKRIREQRGGERSKWKRQKP